jgi:hypothetical protein
MKEVKESSSRTRARLRRQARRLRLASCIEPAKHAKQHEKAAGRALQTTAALKKRLDVQCRTRANAPYRAAE